MAATSFSSELYAKSCFGAMKALSLMPSIMMWAMLCRKAEDSLKEARTVRDSLLTMTRAATKPRAHERMRQGSFHLRRRINRHSCHRIIRASLRLTFWSFASLLPIDVCVLCFVFGREKCSARPLRAQNISDFLGGPNMLAKWKASLNA